MESYYEPCAGYCLPVDVDMTEDLLTDMLSDYKTNLLDRLIALRKAYEGDHAILHQAKKEEYKPDNRIVANYAKEIVDDMVGYFLGVPIRLACDDETMGTWIEQWGAGNDSDDLDAELSKVVDIYGHSFELFWRDEAANPRSSVVGPMNCFLVTDDTVEHTVRYAVRFWRDDNRFDKRPDMLRGTLYDASTETPFQDDGHVTFGEQVPHGFMDVPVVEYIDNEERQGIFEGVMSLIDAHDKALSEKANDVEYYADAYLKVLGADLDDDTLNQLRERRIINLAGMNSDKVDVGFLAKPDADGTQENLINRLERLIFTLSMVSDMSSDTFDTSSGIAIRYRLMAMSNLAVTKERKFRRSLSRRWRLLCGYVGNSNLQADAWTGIRATFTRNLPNNLLEESQIAGNLSGIVSEETQLSVLSCVDNARAEMERKAKEQETTASALMPTRTE